MSHVSGRAMWQHLDLEIENVSDIDKSSKLVAQDLCSPHVLDVTLLLQSWHVKHAGHLLQEDHWSTRLGRTTSTELQLLWFALHLKTVSPEGVVCGHDLLMCVKSEGQPVLFVYQERHQERSKWGIGAVGLLCQGAWWSPSTAGTPIVNWKFKPGDEAMDTWMMCIL